MAHRWRTKQQQGGTTERGYGSEHTKERAARAKQHHPDDPCTRCGHALGMMGPHLHLDHSDDRQTYLGFAHGSKPCAVCGRRCNERAGAQEGNRRSQAPTLRW